MGLGALRLGAKAPREIGGREGLGPGAQGRKGKSADPLGVWKSVFFGLRSSTSVISIVHSNQLISLVQCSVFNIVQCSVLFSVHCSLF